MTAPSYVIPQIDAIGNRLTTLSNLVVIWI